MRIFLILTCIEFSSHIKFFFAQTLILLTYVQLTNGQSKMHFCQAPSESPNDGGNLIKAPSTVFVKSRMALFFIR